MRRHVMWTIEAIVALRKRLSLTQEQFAHRIGVTTSSVNRWERGHAEPSRLACQKLTELANGGPRE